MTDFTAWRESLGFHMKEIAKAGELIGFGPFMARRTHQGKRKLTTTDRLAMAAVRAGLPPWTPENDQVCVNVKPVVDAVMDAHETNERVRHDGEMPALQ